MAGGYDGSIRIDTELDNTGFEKGSEKLLNATEQLSKSIADIGKSFNADNMGAKCISLERTVMSLHDKLTRLGTSASIGFSNQGQVARFGDSVDIIARKIEELKAKLQQLGSAKTPTAEYAALDQELEKAKTDLDALIAKQTEWENMGLDTGGAWDSLIEQTAQASDRVDDLKAKMETLNETGRAFTLGSDTAEYKQTEQSIQMLENQLIEVEGAGSKAAQGVSSIGRSNVVLKLVQGTLRTMQATLKKIAATGFRAISSAMRNLHKESHSARGAIEYLTRSLMSLKTMLLSRIKRMFISSIFNDVKEGIQSLARYSESFNRSMSNIKNSAKQVSGNVAVAFGNLISALEPVLLRIINLISTALTYINAFFAIFKGGQTVTVAKKGMDSYAKSTGGAAKAQKKLNAELYGWDELTRQSKNEDSGGGAGGGGIEFEEVPLDDALPEKLKNWMERIKEAFDAGNWYGIGEIIAEGLNAALKKIDDWINNEFRPKGVEWAKRIAQILNGLTDKFDWRLLGKTISDGLAAAFDIGATFLETYNFSKLGAGLAKSIDAIFQNKDMWNQAARFFAGAFNAAIDTAWGFIQEALPNMFNWGATIGGALLDMLDGIHWDKLSETITNGVKGVIQFLKGFVSDENRWKEVGAKISESFNKTVKNLDLGGLGTALSDVLMRVIEWLKILDWETLGYQIGLMLGNIDWPGILVGVGEIIVDALWGAVKGFLDGDHGWSTALMLSAAALLKTAFGLAVAAVSHYLITTALPQLGAAIVGKITGSSIFTTISGWVTGGAASVAGTAGSVFLAALAGLFIGGEIGKLIDNYIIGPMIEAFDGDKLTAEMYKNFHWFGEGGFFDQMWDGSEDFKGNVAVWVDALKLMFSDLGEDISLGWSKLKETVSSAADTMKTNVSTAWGNMTSDIKQKVDSIKQDVSTGWNNLKQNTTEAYNNIKQTISSKLNEAKTNAGTAISNMKQSAVTAWENMKTTASSSFESIRSTVQAKIDAAGQYLKNLKWDQIGRDLIAGFFNGLKSKWDEVASWVSESASKLTAKMKDVFDIGSPSKVWAQIGSFLDEGLLKGLESGERSLLSEASGIAAGLTDRMSGSGTLGLADATDIDMLDVITDKISGIAAIIDHIAEALASMGGLEIPQIAAGTVVPPRTKVGANAAGDNGENAAGYGYTDEATQLLRNIRDFLSTFSNQRNGTVKVLIDGREVFQAVVDENNRAIARTGASPIRV